LFLEFGVGEVPLREGCGDHPISQVTSLHGCTRAVAMWRGALKDTGSERMQA